MNYRQLPRHHWIASNDQAFAIRAPQPQRDGHSIILAHRSVEKWPEVSPEIRQAFWDLVALVKVQLNMLNPKPERIQFQFEEKENDTELHILPVYPESVQPIAKEESIELCTGGTKDPFLPIIREGFRHSIRSDVVSAFVQDSGLRILQPTLLDALHRGAHIRILTSDYLHITQARALQRFLDWQDQLQLQKAKGLLEVKVYEAETQSFHPKSWAFSTKEQQYAYVGSSNWSYTALCTGIEWNLRLDAQRNPSTYAKLQLSFQRLWRQAAILSSEWLEGYVQRCAESEQAYLPIGEIEEDVKRKIPNSIPLFYANFKISNKNKIYKNQKVTAFAGIAYPEKFYNSLTEQGAILEKKISYPDHHIFDENDMLNLAETANMTKSILVTTKKDFVRIPKSYRSLVSTLDGEIEFEDENLFMEILGNLLENKINSFSV